MLYKILIYIKITVKVTMSGLVITRHITIIGIGMVKLKAI